ncbi:MAG: lysophospholipid acyltransferase family protein [Geobacter sp.]|nr:lysophospholipid acyltransferase family protein [Geobacter sp.]
MKESLKWFSAYIGLLTLLIPFALLPLSVSAHLGRYLGRLLKIILPKWHRIGLQTVSERLDFMQRHPLWNSGNLQPGELIDQLFANTGLFIAELSKLYFGMDSELMAAVEIRGLEHYTTAHARGRGIIGITAHAGNWELMALTFGAKIHPVGVVARNMKRGYLDAMLEKIRLRHGNHLIYRDSGAKEMLQLLKNNGVLGILPDQVVKPPHGIPANFLGAPAWTSVMPAKLTIKTGCAMLPFFTHKEGGKNIITIYPELEIPQQGSEAERILELTTRMNSAIGEHVIRHPAQWNWLYRRWKGNPGAAV